MWKEKKKNNKKLQAKQEQSSWLMKKKISPVIRLMFQPHQEPYVPP